MSACVAAGGSCSVCLKGWPVHDRGFNGKLSSLTVSTLSVTLANAFGMHQAPVALDMMTIDDRMHSACDSAD